MLEKTAEEDRPALTRAIGLEPLCGADAAASNRCQFRLRTEAARPQWLECSVYVLNDPPDPGAQALLILRDMTVQKEQEREGQRLLQYNVAIQNTYDELYELNINSNTYRIIHHVVNKYVSLPESGNLQDAAREVSQHLVHPLDRARFLAFFDKDEIHRRFAQGAAIVTGEFRRLRTNGQYQWISLTMVPLQMQDEKLLLCFIMDVDEQKNARNLAHQNQLLRQRQLDDERYRIIVERTNTIVIEINLESQFIYFSPALQEFALSKQLKDHLQHLYLDYSTVFPEDIPIAEAAFNPVLSGQQDLVDTTIRLQKKDGAYVWCKITLTVLRRNDGSAKRLILTLNDVDDAVRAQLSLAYRAEYDMLTGYRNFASFKRLATDLLVGWHDKRYALLYSDVKNFKFINDIYGYDIGDRLLQYWADIYSKSMQEGETFARISSDQFTSLRHYARREELEERFHDAVQQLNQFEELKKKKFPIHLACGVYCIETQEDLLSIEEMLDRANVAQKSVKLQGGSRLAFYTEKMRSQIIQEKAMESDMRPALHDGQFCIYLQAQVDIQHGYQVVGAESLARWNWPGKGLVSPGEFIPLFEKNGFIVELDRFMFEESCRYLRRLLDEGHKACKIATNVSRVSVFQPDFLETYVELKQRYGIPDGLLELECTETSMVENPQEMVHISKELRKSGFRLSMDDFGAGYSSLNVLKDLTVDILKLDMAFFRNGLTTERDRTIVESIVAMAKTLQMQVIAEGVEAAEQVAFLQSIGCDMVQGFIFSKPVPAAEFLPDTVLPPTACSL